MSNKKVMILFLNFEQKKVFGPNKEAKKRIFYYIIGPVTLPNTILSIEKNRGFFA
jgi:hypothetical protein